MRSIQYLRFAAIAAAYTTQLLGCTHAAPINQNGLRTVQSASPVGQWLRPPAAPLITSDPYLSIWSKADNLNGDVTRHWTGRPQPLISVIRIDGHSYRLMGDSPSTIDAMPQTSEQALPTRTIYGFDNGQVHVVMTFLDPALPNDLAVLSRPLNYITWRVHSVDGRGHQVQVLQTLGSDLAVNDPSQPVVWQSETAGSLSALRVGTQKQTYLTPPGDDARIDWGYAYLAAPTALSSAAIMGENAVTSAFSASGRLPGTTDARMPRPPSDDRPTLAVAFDMGTVGAQTVQRHAMIAYDEIYAIKFFGQRLAPYWRKNFKSAPDLLVAAERDYASLTRRSAIFDQELMRDMTQVGGPSYAQIAALAYRQCLAANGLAVDKNGQPLMFTKENGSDGDTATVDVIFPQDPMMVFLSPTLAKAGLAPVLLYGSSPRWKFPNAPHDLGPYPVARGTDDGGEQMPVEESGNIIILCDAIAHDDGNANFVTPWWPHISQWAQYLEQYGLDPGDQLCTDDFMGHLAHNANLSIKAVVALAAYADLCRMRGETANAVKYRALAKRFAAHWVKVADAGDHSLLAFDKPGTWSQKYNLVWDKILGLNVFPPSVAQREVAYYRTVLQPYGLPLDSRTKLSKSDWTMWSATLSNQQTDFEALISPLYRYLDTTTAHEPLADSYQTDDIKSVGMRARSVVGGEFIKMLTVPAVWSKWAGKDHERVGGWAPLPDLTVKNRIPVVPTSREQPQVWRYTTSQHSSNWTDPSFDDSSWSTGTGPFGTNGTPGATFNTTWNTDDIWLRRTVTLPSSPLKSPEVLLYHDEDAEVYVNGVLAAEEAGYDNSYSLSEITPEARALLKPGAVIHLAVHCHQTTGGQGIDVGIVDTAP